MTVTGHWFVVLVGEEMEQWLVVLVGDGMALWFVVLVGAVTERGSGLLY